MAYLSVLELLLGSRLATNDIGAVPELEKRVGYSSFLVAGCPSKPLPAIELQYHLPTLDKSLAIQHSFQAAYLTEGRKTLLKISI